jgi:hypothetical protein
MEELNMRKWFFLVAATLLVLGAAGVAGAAPMQFRGTATITIGEIPPFVLTGGGVATVNNSAGAIGGHLSTLRMKASRGVVSGTATEPITDPKTQGNDIYLVIVQGQLGTGTFAPISGGMQSLPSASPMTRNLVPVYGMAKVCLISTACEGFIDVPFTKPTTINGVAYGDFAYAVGIGGTVAVGGGATYISLEGAPWTIKTVGVWDNISTTGGLQKFTLQTHKGWVHAPNSTTSTTAQPSGVVQLVSPGQIHTTLQYGANAKLAGMLVTVIHFIPEPGLLLLLGSGVVGLCLLGRKRMR